jgi:hypothetical protein
MGLVAVVMVVVSLLVRTERQPGVPMGTVVVMVMCPQSVTVPERPAHRRTDCPFWCGAASTDEVTASHRGVGQCSSTAHRSAVRRSDSCSMV